MSGRGWSGNPPHPETQNDINKFTSVVDDGGLNPTAFSVDNEASGIGNPGFGLGSCDRVTVLPNTTSRLHDLLGSSCMDPSSFIHV